MGSRQVIIVISRFVLVINVDMCYYFGQRHQTSVKSKKKLQFGKIALCMCIVLWLAWGLCEGKYFKTTLILAFRYFLRTTPIHNGYSTIFPFFRALCIRIRKSEFKAVVYHSIGILKKYIFRATICIEIRNVWIILTRFWYLSSNTYTLFTYVPRGRRLPVGMQDSKMCVRRIDFNCGKYV